MTHLFPVARDPEAVLLAQPLGPSYVHICRILVVCFLRAFLCCRAYLHIHCIQYACFFNALRAHCDKFNLDLSICKYHAVVLDELSSHLRYREQKMYAYFEQKWMVENYHSTIKICDYEVKAQSVSQVKTS